MTSKKVLSWPFLVRGVGLLMQMAGTVLAVQTMPVAEVAAYFAIVAAANLISALTDFGFCQYAFRYLNRGVPLRLVFAAALVVTLMGGAVCVLLGVAVAELMRLPALLFFAAIAGSSIHKLTMLNASVQLIRHRAALAMLIGSLQPTLFAFLMLAYAGLVPEARSSRGTIDVVFSIYLVSFAISFPIAVALCRLGPEWRKALAVCRVPRKRDIPPFLRTVRRSILLAVEWNLTSLWMSFLVLWFQTAGYNYETAVMGVLQRALSISRTATAVSVQVRLTYYYKAAMSPSYLVELATHGLFIGCGVAATAAAGEWIIGIGQPWLAPLNIAEMLVRLSRYWFLLGVICVADYLFFHLSSFALGLNRKIIRVAAPAAGLSLLLGAGFIAKWVEPRDRVGFALLAYATSLSIAGALLGICLMRFGTRQLTQSQDLVTRQPPPSRWRSGALLGVRKANLLFFRHELPERLAVFLHEVLSADYDRFREFISYFKMAEYAFVDALGFCSPGGGRRVFLSFDDNYRSWVDLLRILDENRVSATFFVNTLPFRDVADRTSINNYFDRINHTGERETLSTTELRELSVAGHTIGCHSHSHFDLTTLDVSALRAELLRSKELLEELGGKQIVDFAYPFGMRRHFGEWLRTYCLDLGFQSISNSIPGRQHPPQRLSSINRTRWTLERDLTFNLDNLRLDGRIFERLTGRSPIG